jgi:hypothetical protein
MTDDRDLQHELDALAAKVRVLEDQQALAQLVASYGPAVDSGSADATANLWFEDGVFDVVPYWELVGHEGIAGMVEGEGHQGLIMNGCGHVLTAPKIVVDGDEARGWNYAMNIRWDAEAERFWIGRLSANEWHWRRGPGGWRTVRRTNVNLDGEELPRSLFRRSTEIGATSARTETG